MDCPPTPSNASKLVCSDSGAPGGGSIYLVPDRTTWLQKATRTAADGYTGGVIRSITFTLRGNSVTPFTTNTGSWKLLRRTSNGWAATAGGDPSEGRSVSVDVENGPYRWQLSRQTHPTPHTSRMTFLDVDFPPGDYALVVTGSQAGSQKQIACAGRFSYHPTEGSGASVTS